MVMTEGFVTHRAFWNEGLLILQHPLSAPAIVAYCQFLSDRDEPMLEVQGYHPYGHVLFKDIAGVSISHCWFEKIGTEELSGWGNA